MENLTIQASDILHVWVVYISEREEFRFLTIAHAR